MQEIQAEREKALREIAAARGGASPAPAPAEPSALPVVPPSAGLELPSNVAAAGEPVSRHAAESDAAGRPGSRTLVAGDLVGVQVVNVTDGELAVRVSRDGSLRLPRLGQIPAKGCRLFELKAEIAKRVVRLTPEPEVHLWLVDESRAARSL